MPELTTLHELHDELLRGPRGPALLRRLLAAERRGEMGGWRAVPERSINRLFRVRPQTWAALRSIAHVATGLAGHHVSAGAVAASLLELALDDLLHRDEANGTPRRPLRDAADGYVGEHGGGL